MIPVPLPIAVESPMFSKLRISLLIIVLVSLTTVGCGSSGDVGYVYGVVTLNGEPLPHATVSFYPTGARASVGRTDENGKYVLHYVKNEDGAVIGEHRVTVSTRVAAEVDRGDRGYDGEGARKQSVLTQGRSESMPAKYLNPEKTELSAIVKSGSNKIDFDLSL